MEYELRPLTLAEIFDAAFRLVQTRWRTLVGLSMLMQLPIMLLASQAAWLFDPFAQPFESNETPSPEELMEMGLVGAGFFLAYLILYPFVAGAVTAAVGNFYLGRRFSMADAAKAGFNSIVRLVMAYLVYVIVISLGITAIAVAGVLFGTAMAGIFASLESLGTLGSIVGFVGVAFVVVFALYWALFLATVNSLLAPVLMLESKGIFASVARALKLGGTAKLRLMGVVFTSGIIVGIPVIGAQMMVGFVPYLGLVIWAVFQAIGFAFTTSVAVVLYFDLRCRAENYDLELLAEQVEAGPGLGQR